MMIRSRLKVFAVWLTIAALAGAIGHYGFDTSFWLVAVLTIMSLVVNGWIIEWEDRQPGGWGNP
jgi:uncharacterized membrane protein AbrB (regulator of aidB expression)